MIIIRPFLPGIIFFLGNEAKKRSETTIYTGNGCTSLDKKSQQTKDEISSTKLKLYIKTLQLFIFSAFKMSACYLLQPQN